MTWLAVGLGGGLGALARYGLARGAERLAPAASLPLGTLAANVVGCFVIGVLGVRLSPAAHPQAFALLVTGFLGGFTTFSAFGFEHVALVQRGATGAALLHAAAHVVGGLGAAWLGQAVARAG